MKDAVYTAAVTAQYRRLLDGQEADSDAEKRLNQVFNRGGASTSGYFTTHAGHEMMSPQTPKNTGILAGAVIRYDIRRGACSIRAYEPFSAGDGLEIRTRTQPHCGAGISGNVRAGDIFTIRIQGDIHPGDQVYKTYDKQLEDGVAHEMSKDTRKRLLIGRFTAKAGERAALELQCQDIVIKVYSDVPQTAKTIETDADEIKARLSKTGSSTFRIDWERFEVEKGLFFPVSSLNSLRRDALQEMGAAILEKSRRKLSFREIPAAHWTQAERRKRIHVSVARTDQLEAALKGGADRIILEPEAADFTLNPEKLCHGYGAELFLALPLAGDPAPFMNLPADGYYARSWGHLSGLAKSGKPVIADYTIQVFNQYSTAYIRQFCQGICLSPEMNLPEAKENARADSELIVYGRLPLMNTRQCPIGNFAAGERGKGGLGCPNNRDSQFALTDRKGYVYPIERDCKNCNAMILNPVTTDLYKKAREILAVPCGAFRIMLFDEGADEPARVVKRFADIVSLEL